MSAVLFVAIGFVVGYAVHYFSKGQTKKEIETQLEALKKEIKEATSKEV